MTYTYLASPYSHPDHLVRERRYVQAMDCVAWLIESRVWTFSPIVHCHELAKRKTLRTDSLYWRDYNRAMLSGAARLLILTLDGWQNSKGVSEEVNLAHASSKPIEFIAPYAWIITEEPVT